MNQEDEELKESLDWCDNSLESGWCAKIVATAYRQADKTLKEMANKYTELEMELSSQKAKCLQICKQERDEWKMKYLDRNGGMSDLHPTMQDFERRLQQVKVQAAAMREALDNCKFVTHYQGWEEIADGLLQDIDQALSSEAGKEFLDRLAEAERSRDEWREVANETGQRSIAIESANTIVRTQLEYAESKIRELEAALKGRTGSCGCGTKEKA